MYIVHVTDVKEVLTMSRVPNDEFTVYYTRGGDQKNARMSG